MNSFRRYNKKESINIWPGFVDAMTALLLVLMFVLSIFMIVQSVLRETISGQNNELSQLNNEINELQNNLLIEKSKLKELDEIFEMKLIEFNNLEIKLDIEKRRLKKLNEQFIERSEKLEVANQDLLLLNYRLFALAEQLGNKSEELSLLEEKYQKKQVEFFSISSTVSEQLLTISNLQKDNKNLSQKLISFEMQVANLLNDKKNFIEDNNNIKKELEDKLSSLEKAKLIISKTRKEIDIKNQEARLAAARSEALEEYAKKLKLENQKYDLRNKNLEISLQEVENQNIIDQAAINSLRQSFQLQKEEFNILTLSLDTEKKEALKTLELLASSKAIRKILEEKNKNLLKETNDEKEKSEARRIALLEARYQLTKEQKLSKATLLELETIQKSTELLKKQIISLQNILDKSEESEKNNKIQIQTLGNRLNAALAKVASEQKKRADNLEFYKSEFFGELRKILDNLDGVEVVGDRFLFSSEILFDSGSDILEVDGKNQIDKFAKVLKNISLTIPKNINWILRVDGHTDKIPLKNNLKFSDNWELSQARALSVVKYLINEHKINPKRLVAAGFGEFQPLNKANTTKGNALNRRIELKITER